MAKSMHDNQLRVAVAKLLGLENLDNVHRVIIDIGAGQIPTVYVQFVDCIALPDVLAALDDVTVVATAPIKEV